MKSFVGVYIKISPQQKEKLKDLDIGITECFEIGYEKIMENERSELEKLVKKYHEKYILVYTKLENFDKKNDQKELNKVEKAIQIIKNSYDPSFFIGKEVEGVKITKALLKKEGILN